MRTAVFITGRFLRAHKWKAVLAVLIISVFIAAFQSAFIYNDSYEKTMQYNIAKQYGQDAGIIYNTNIEDTERFLSKPSEEFIGFCGYGLISNDDLETDMYVGYMPKAVLDNKLRKVTEGRLPEKEGEAAVEESVYYALGLTAKIGESFSINVEENGKSVKHSYTLCGIIENYLNNWQYCDSSKKSLICPPPAVLVTIQPDVKPCYIDIMCKNKPEGNNYFGGEFSQTNISADDDNVASDINAIYFLTTPFAAFFLIVMLLGVYSVLQYIMSDFDKYIRLLNCIGMPLRKCIPMYLILAFLTIISTSAVGSLLGVGISYAFSEIISTIISGQGQIFSYDIKYAGFGCAVCAAVILTVFIFSICKYYISSVKKRRMQLMGISRRRSYKRGTEPFYEDTSLAKMWKKAKSKKYLSQNILSGILIFFCILIAGFGMFYSQASLISSNYDLTNTGESSDEDYLISIPYGWSDPKYYYIDQPEGSGLSAKSFKELTDTDGLSDSYALMSETFGGFILYDPSAENEYLDGYIEQNSYLTAKSTPTYEYALKAAGGGEGEYLLYVRTYGASCDALKKTFGINNIDEQQFKNGNIIAAPENAFNIGDKLTMLTVSVNDHDKDATDPAKYNFYKTTFTVGALTPYDNFIISSEYLSAIHKNIKYSEVSLKVSDPSDKELTEALNEKVTSVVSRIQFLSLRNLIEEREEYHNKSVGSVLNFTVIIIIFVLFSLTAVVISTKLKAKANIQSFFLMKQIGADNNAITKLMTSDNLNVIITSGVAAISINTLISLVFTVMYHYLPLIGLFAGCFILGIALTAFIAIFCYKISKSETKKLFKN